MKRLRLKSEHRTVLIELYTRINRTVDDLPYTEEFESIYTGFIARTGFVLTRHDFWRVLSSCRKARRLVRKER